MLNDSSLPKGLSHVPNWFANVNCHVQSIWFLPNVRWAQWTPSFVFLLRNNVELVSSNFNQTFQLDFSFQMGVLWHDIITPLFHRNCRKKIVHRDFLPFLNNFWFLHYFSVVVLTSRVLAGKHHLKQFGHFFACQFDEKIVVWSYLLNNHKNSIRQSSNATARLLYYAWVKIFLEAFVWNAVHCVM